MCIRDRSGIVLLPGLCPPDVYWPSLGLCAFDVTRTRCAALRYMGKLCVVPQCDPAGTMCARHVLAERRVVNVRRQSNPLCCPAVRRTICVVPGCAPARTMWTRHVLSEAMVVCVRRKSNPLSCPAVRGPICVVPDCAPVGTMCARRVLSKPRVVCVRQ